MRRWGKVIFFILFLVGLYIVAYNIGYKKEWDYIEKNYQECQSDEYYKTINIPEENLESWREDISDLYGNFTMEYRLKNSKEAGRRSAIACVCIAIFVAWIIKLVKQATTRVAGISIALFVLILLGFRQVLFFCLENQLFMPW